MSTPGTGKIEAFFDRFAGRYDRRMGIIERLLFAGSRDWALADARGRVVEIAVGTGLNLPRYGPTLQSVVGVDVSDGMLAVARRRVADEGLGPSTHAFGRAVLRAIEPLMLRFAADHLTRDPVPCLADAGFVVDEVHRVGLGGTAFRVLAHKPMAAGRGPS